MKKRIKINKSLYILITVFILIGCFFQNINSKFKNTVVQETYNEIYDTDNIQDIPHTKNAIVHFLNTGNSDSIIIKYQDKIAVIDGGDNNDENYIVKYLNDLDVETIDFLQMTHTDADHCGGLDAIVDNFAINTVFVSNGDANTKTYKDFINSLTAKKLYASVPLDETILKWDDNTYFQFFNTKTISKDPNKNSIITLFVNGNDTFLFTGDATKEQEEIYMNQLPQIDVLKVGHHGSYTSTSSAFIDAINPTYSIILCGENNDYGHPHEITLETLKDSIIYRTDLHGTIRVLSTGNSISIQTEK